jgi:hypothetical protein
MFVEILTFYFKSENDIEANRGGGARGSVVVKALCYKPEGRGFHTR